MHFFQVIFEGIFCGWKWHVSWTIMLYEPVFKEAGWLPTLIFDNHLWVILGEFAIIHPNILSEI